MDELLDALEAELPSAQTPEALVELAGRVDALGSRVAAVVANGDASRRALLIKVPALYVRVLLLAAERFDDRGSARRATVVLLEAMRRAFTPVTLADEVTAIHAAVDWDALPDDRFD